MTTKKSTMFSFVFVLILAMNLMNFMIFSLKI